MRDAAMFPLYASIGLFGLYLFFKVSQCGYIFWCGYIIILYFVLPCKVTF